MARIRYRDLCREPQRDGRILHRSFRSQRDQEKSEGSNLLIRRLYQCCAFGAAKRCDPKGLHHFGFEVDSVEATEKRLKEIKPDIEIEQPDPGIAFAEYKIKDVEGNIFDISEKGWEV